MRTSPQAEQFKKCLPEDLQKITEVSFSYQLSWKIISDHLKTIYGEYADPQYCLDAYFHSKAYCSNRQIIRRCPDIPLINEDDIHKMLEEENTYAKTVTELLSIYEEEDSTSVDKTASLLGIWPDKNPNALYKHLIAKNNIPEDAWTEIRTKALQNKNLLLVINNMLIKTFISGYLLEFPATGCVMTQPRSRYYYRGENAYFRSSKASAYRAEKSALPAEIQALIDRMRLYQCWDTLDQFDAVKRWSFSEINYMALAQHYGFRTQMLDITSDLKTALFFACCKYGKDRMWHPLTQDDFAHRNSRDYISRNCNGDSRYGVLYRSPSEITDLRWCTEPKDTAFEIIIPVGYQPFMRCSHQHGYMLLTQPNYDLLQDLRFDKFKFRLTEDLCNWIYEEMDRGEAIYPYDDVPDISDEMGRLNHQQQFSRDVFENAVADFQLPASEQQQVKAVLAQYGITVEENISVILPEKLLQINQNYSVEYAMQKVGAVPQMSPILSIPGDTPVDEENQLILPKSQPES